MTLFGLKLSVDRTALPCSAALWLVLTVAAALLLRLPFGDALILGLAATVLHWLSDIWHGLGHAFVARRIGHPMIGIRLRMIFAFSVYPQDEGDLPARIHVTRALGGPIASVILTVALGVLLLLAAQGTLLWWLLFFGFLENLLIFTAQVFVPLGFNDGATLWKWVPKLLQAHP